MKGHDIHIYTELRRQIHDDLRIQHPEWVQPNGESPICDFYESRLIELLVAPEAMATHAGSNITTAIFAKENRILEFQREPRQRTEKRSQAHA